METDDKNTVQNSVKNLNGEGFKLHNFPNNMDIDTLASNPFLTSCSTLCTDSNDDSSKNILVPTKVFENDDISQTRIPHENQSTVKESTHLTNSKQNVDTSHFSDMLERSLKSSEENNVYAQNSSPFSDVLEISPEKNEEEIITISNLRQKKGSTHLPEMLEMSSELNGEESKQRVNSQHQSDLSVVSDFPIKKYAKKQTLVTKQASEMPQRSFKDKPNAVFYETLSEEKVLQNKDLARLSSNFKTPTKKYHHPISSSPTTQLSYDEIPGKKKEREEKVRQTKEKLEKEKLRKMQSMKEAMARSEALKRLRDEEKRKRMEEVKRKEEEHRMIVEQRRIKLYEKDLERKQAILKKTAEKEAKFDFKKPIKSGIFMPGFSHPNNFFVRPPRSKLKKFESNTNESHSGTVKRSRSQAPINFELENNSNNSTRGVKRPARRDSLSKAKSLANNLHSISDVTTNRAVPKTRTPSNARGQESEMTIKVEEEDINRVITPINLSPHQLWLADDVIDARASSCTFNQQPIVCCKRKLDLGLMSKSVGLLDDTLRSVRAVFSPTSSRQSSTTAASQRASRKTSTEPSKKRPARHQSVAPNYSSATISHQIRSSLLIHSSTHHLNISNSPAPLNSSICVCPRFRSKTPAAMKVTEERASRARSVGNLTRRNRSEMSPQIQAQTVSSKTNNKKIIIEPLKTSKVGRSKTPVPMKSSAPLKAKETPRSSRSVKDPQKDVKNNEDRNNGKGGTRQKPEKTTQKASKVMTTSLESPLLSDQRRKSTGDKLSKSISVPNHNKKRKSLGTPMKEGASQDKKTFLPNHTTPQDRVALVEINGGKVADEGEKKVEDVKGVEERKKMEEIKEVEVVKEVVVVKEVEKKSELSDKEMHQRRLAENRRLAREKAEQEAEEERVRQEKLKAEEEERQRREEEEERRREEEELRMVMEARKAEEERFRKAVEEEEKRRKLEEERLEAERKEKLEAEQRAQEEQAKKEKERQEREEKEAQAKLERKKKLEMIMKRVKTDDTSKAPEANNQTPSKAPEKTMPHPVSQPILDSQEACKDEPSTFKSPLLRQMLGNKLKNKTASSGFINSDAQHDKQPDDINNAGIDVSETAVDTNPAETAVYTNAASSVSASNVSFEIAKEVSEDAVDGDQNNSAGGDEVGASNKSTSNNTSRDIPEITVINREACQSVVKEDTKSKEVQESISEGCIRKSDNILFFQQLQLSEDAVEKETPNKKEEILSIDLIDIKDSFNSTSHDQLNNNNDGSQVVCNDNYILSNIKNDSNNNQTADATDVPNDINDDVSNNRPPEADDSLEAWLNPQV